MGTLHDAVVFRYPAPYIPVPNEVAAAIMVIKIDAGIKFSLNSKKLFFCIFSNSKIIFYSFASIILPVGDGASLNILLKKPLYSTSATAL